MAIVGLIPAAGYATRLAGSVTGSKEVQVVRGRPVMAYLVDRLRLGGASRIVVTVRPDKEDVIALATGSGAEVVTGQPASLGASLLLAAHDLHPDDIALFGFPDTVWTPADGFRRLVALIRGGEPLALGLFESSHPERSDVCTIDAKGRLRRLDSRPESPTSSLIWAAGAARAGVLRTLLREAEPGDAFGRLAVSGGIATARLGRVVDIGLPAALRAASTDPVFDTADDVRGGET